MSAIRKIFVVLLSALAVWLLLNSSAILVKLLDSDTLYPAGLYNNLFVQGFGLSTEAYNDHPGFFPDCLVYWALLALFPLGPATALYAIAWFSCLLVLTYLLLRRIGVEQDFAILGTLCAGVWDLLIFYQPPVTSPGDRQLLQVMYPHSHGTAILLGLFLVLVLQRCSHTGHHLRTASLLFFPTVLAVVSDKIVMVHTLAPFCLTLLLLCWKRPSLKAKVWIPFCIFSSLTGLLIIEFFPYLGLGCFDGVYGVSKISASIDLTVLKDIILLSLDCPSLGIALASWFLLSLFSLFKLLALSSEEIQIQDSILFQTFLLATALGTLGAVAVSKYWSGLSTIRYIFPLFVLAPIGVVLAISALERRRTLYLALGALTVLGSIPCLGSPDFRFQVNDLSTPYPADVRCLDEMAKEHGITRGYSEYWSARRANLFSRAGLSITPVHSRMVPYPMSANLEAANGPGDVEFILTTKLDKELLRGLFGKPASIRDCLTTDVLIVDPNETVFKERGSLLHVGLMELGEGSLRMDDLSVVSPSSAEGSRIAIYGPYLALTAGEYVFSSEIEVAEKEGGLDCEVVASGQILAREQKSLSDFQSGRATLKIPFTVTKSMVGRVFEFRVWKTGAYRLHIASVNLFRSPESLLE